MQSNPFIESSSQPEQVGQVRCCILGWLSKRKMTLLLFGLTFCFSGCHITQSWNDASIPTVSQLRSLPEMATESRQAILVPFLPESEKGELPKPAGTVEPLSLRDCEALAATNAPLAKILEEESQSSPCDCSNVDQNVQASINAAINANASYQRNIAAEKALLAYLGLTEVYLQTQVSRESIEEIGKLQDVLAQLQLEGLVREVDPELLVRKKLDLQSKRSELIFNFDDLNQKLRLLLGLHDSANPIWTDCQIEGWALPDNLDSEIELAMQNRADIIALRSFIQCGSDDLLEMMRSSIRSVSPLAAIAIQRRFFGGIFKDNSAEIQKLRMQLAILNESQIALVKSEVTESFYAIQKYSALIELSQKKLESLRRSESRLGARRQVGPIKIDEVLAVKSAVLETRSELIHSAILLQMEWIKMKSRQGLLGATETNSHDIPISTPQKDSYKNGGSSPQVRLPPRTTKANSLLPKTTGRSQQGGAQVTGQMQLNPPKVSKASYQEQSGDGNSLSEMLRRKRFELAPLR